MSYFKSHDEMLAEAETLIHEARHESEDEAVLSSFYNGGNLGEDDAGHSGSLKNHLMGYDSMNDARLALEGVYTRQKLPWKVKLSNVPVGKRQQWEMTVENNMNRVIRKSKRLKGEWKGLCGTVTLMGRGCLVFADKWDWCPRLMSPLVPRRTGLMPETVPYAVIPGSLTIKSLKEYLVMARSNPESSWKASNLQACIETLTDNIGTKLSQGTASPTDKITAAEIQEASADGWNASLRAAILVFHVYENCQEDSGVKYVKHTILARHDEDTRKKHMERTGDSIPSVLYQDSNFADNPNEWLNPYFIDCKIGKTATWHNIMGLGRLNYDADVETEAFLNEAMAGSMENLRRLYQVEDGADIDKLEQFLSGDSKGNIMPAGLKAAETAKNSNFQYAFQVIGMLKQISTGHSKSSVPNTADGGTKELEVQAIERQGRNAISLASRMEDFYDNTDALGAEILRRFLTIEPLPTDTAYHEIMDFQESIKKAGVPIAKLREKARDGSLKNISVTTNRSMGQGDRVSEIMVNRMLMQRLHLFSPQAQQMILRRVTAVETGDHDLAQDLVPDRPKVDPRQIERANTENQICLMRGIAGHVPQLNDDDMPQYHITEHMGGLEAMLAKGQAQGWEPMDIGAFKSLGSHIMLHIQQMEEDPEQKNTARQLIGRLQELGSAADKLAKAAAEKQQQDEISAGERERLRMAQEKIDFAKEKEANVVANRRDQLLLKEAELTSKDVVAGVQLDLKKRQLANDEFKVDSANLIKANELSQDTQVPATA